MSNENYPDYNRHFPPLEHTFDMLDAYADKRTAGEWSKRRIRRVIGTNTISLYKMDAAEELIRDFYETDETRKSQNELDEELTLDERYQCDTVYASFHATRLSPHEQNNFDITTQYKVSVEKSVPINPLSDIPYGLSARVQNKLHAAYVKHTEQSHGESIDEDLSDTAMFDPSVFLTSQHIFTLDESQEYIDYRIRTDYEGPGFHIPIARYNSARRKSHKVTMPEGIFTANAITDKALRNSVNSRFKEVVQTNFSERLLAGSPETARAAQVLAILSLIDYGSPRTDDERRLINELI